MEEAEIIAAHCKSVLPLATVSLGAGYGYDCLPTCVIDAVWSIGVRYSGLQNVVSRYQAHFGLEDDTAREQHRVRNLILAMQTQGVEWFAERVFQNAQRTSTRNGILKAEAVYRFASILHRHGMECVQDIPKLTSYEDLHLEMKKPYAQELLSIPGQCSGISLAYFYMLTGSPGIVKPDRMVNGFPRDVLHRDVTDDDAQRLLSHASQQLNLEYPLLTPRYSTMTFGNTNRAELPSD